MSKRSKKREINKKSSDDSPRLEITSSVSGQTKIILCLALIVLTIGLSIYFIYYSYSINKDYGFPFDDAWIHLNFAKNIAEYGSYSYFKNEVVTSGSTSPLYTFILAIGFLLTKNEMVLSYVLGIMFFALSVFIYYKLSDMIFPREYWLVIFCVLLFALDKWMNFISVSGMETTLFIFDLLICFYFYKRRAVILFGITLGLIMWIRPDGIAFIGAIIIDYLLLLYLKKVNPSLNQSVRPFSKRELIKISSILFLFLASYFVMNWKLSGTLLPNTFAAKLAFYSPGVRSGGRTHFLINQTWSYFTESNYVLLIVPFLISVIFISFNFIKKRYTILNLPALFIFLLIFIYWYEMPYAQRFGRYLMPIIPFYILLFVYGSRKLFESFYNFINVRVIINSLNFVFFGIVLSYSVIAYNDIKTEYQDFTNQMITTRVITGKWIRDNTPQDAIIGTHEAGAIAFYSERKIIDVAGLINPEFVSKIYDPAFTTFIIDQMKKQNVSYVAFLRDWFTVANENALFATSEQNLDRMLVYKFDPLRFHILKRDLSAMFVIGQDFFLDGQMSQALNQFKKLYSMDTSSSLSAYYLGQTYLKLGDSGSGEKYLLKALQIFPGYRDAAFSIADFYKRQNKMSLAKQFVIAYLQTNPSDTSAVTLLKSISDLK